MFDFYTRFYQAVAASATNARYCTLVYGRNLCQHGFADMPDIDHLIRVSGIASGSRVLDLGCGNGMIAEYISDQTGAHVTGVDFIARAILDAQARTQDQRGRLAFHEMDIAHLDFAPASFDVIISIDTLYFGDARETVQQALPLLKPGGRLIVFFAECCPPGTPLQAYPKEQTLPDGTRLAQALQRLGLRYQTWDYSGQMLAHVRRRQPILQALMPAFQAEGNQFLCDSHLTEAIGTERALANGAGGRYLYLVSDIEPCTIN